MGLSIGQVAVERGFITPQQLQEAVRIQEQVQLLGLTETLPEIFLKKGWMTPEQIAVVHSLIGQGVQQVIPGYEVLEKIGKGGMGSVYRARRLQDDRAVAIKTLLPGFASVEGAVDRFLREAHWLMKLRHENLVAGLDAGFQKGIYYYVMEVVDGDELAELILRRRRLPWRDVFGWAKQAARGLQYAAANGIVHRDIKPANLLIRNDGLVKVADLGIAKMSDPTGLDASLTGTSIVGTAQYMSPEQAEGRKDIDHRSDMYSLGLTIFTAVSGAPPFQDEAQIRVLQRRLQENVPVDELRPYGVPDNAITLLRTMCARARSERYDGWDDLLRDMEDVEKGRSLDQHAVAVKGGDAASGLLGRLALNQGYVTREQLERAVQIQEKLMKSGQRKLLGNILVEEGYLKGADLKKLLAMQSFHERHGADKSLGELIVENGIAPAFAVQDALREQADMFRHQGYSLTLDQILCKKNIINEQQRKAILRLSRRVFGKAGVSEDLIGVKECPNCVEVIPLQSSRCPRCHFLLEKPKSQRTCAACGSALPAEASGCGRCGAGLRREITTRLVACLSCGKLAPSGATDCSHCGAPLKPSAARVAVMRTGRIGRRILSQVLALALPLGFVGVAIYVFFSVFDGRSVALGVLKGDAGRAQVAAERFLEANIHGDYLTAHKLFHNRAMGTPVECMQEQQRFFQNAAPGLGAGYRLTQFEIEKVEGGRDVATAYVKLTFIHPDRPIELFTARATLYMTRPAGEWKILF